MNEILKLNRFWKPYYRKSIYALILLTAVVFMDLAIPRLIQRIIDQGIAQKNQQLVIQTALLMLGITVLSTIFAILSGSSPRPSPIFSPSSASSTPSTPCSRKTSPGYGW